jgi:hypothetical protein
LKDPRSQKRALGQYFTERDAFGSPAFAAWYARATQGLPKSAAILEPFMGAGHIPRALASRGIVRPWHGVDLDPPPLEARVMPGLVIHKGNSLRQIPRGFALAITNPPYLARNWAARRKMAFPKTIYDDLYKLALEKMLQKVSFVAAIVPASFIVSGQFRHRLTAVVALREDMFLDTQCPVCLALFEPPVTHALSSDDFAVWDGSTYLGHHGQFQTHLVSASARLPWRFNDPQGEVALFGIDNVIGPTIRFALGNEVAATDIKHSSRIISRIGLPTPLTGARVPALIAAANTRLWAWRQETHDVVLSPFRGLRRDGHWRRRLDFATARRLLDLAAEDLT